MHMMQQPLARSRRVGRFSAAGGGGAVGSGVGGNSRSGSPRGGFQMSWNARKKLLMSVAGLFAFASLLMMIAIGSSDHFTKLPNRMQRSISKRLGMPPAGPTQDAQLQNSNGADIHVPLPPLLDESESLSKVERWSTERAWAWHKKMGWLVGATYIPSYAVNQLDMFSHDKWDEEIIRRELQWASESGVTCTRVFLHDLMMKDMDPRKALAKIDTYLGIADGFGIKTIFVLFNACWLADSSTGKQPEPLPFVHNSQWLQCPSHGALADDARWPDLRNYIQSVIKRFRLDPRIAAWDIYNEPSNAEVYFTLVGKKVFSGHGSGRRVLSQEQKYQRTLRLLERAFLWARATLPMQPLTSAIWGSMSPDDFDRPGNTTSTLFARVQHRHSDILSFHNYDTPDEMGEYIKKFSRFGRPVLCTDYVARTINSTLIGNLPVLHANGIGAISWGVVAGRTQTIYPWNSWYKTYQRTPAVWHYDLMDAEGRPHNPLEIATILQLKKSGLRPSPWEPKPQGFL